VETTEKIVEAYCRYIKHWFTIPDVRVKNNEIDLIAVDRDGNKAHIEMGFYISGGLSRLKKSEGETGEDSSPSRQTATRTSLSYLQKKKFNAPEIINELNESYGFDKEQYKKIIVTWNAEEETIKAAEEDGIEIWLLPKLIEEIQSQPGKEIWYYLDETMRMLQLAAKTAVPQRKKEKKQVEKQPAKARGIPSSSWELFVSELPMNVSTKTFSISQISKAINYDLESEKAPTEYNQYWQSKNTRTDIWKNAGWKASPIRDHDSKKITAVKFIKIAQGKFI